jgi:serine/threonine protein kinase
MELKGAKPGNFTPHCPQCGEKFALVVSHDAGVAPLVGKLKHHASEKVTPDIESALGIEPSRPPRKSDTQVGARVVPDAQRPRPAERQEADRPRRSAGDSSHGSMAGETVSPPRRADRLRPATEPSDDSDVEPRRISSGRIDITNYSVPSQPAAPRAKDAEETAPPQEMEPVEAPAHAPARGRSGARDSLGREQPSQAARAVPAEMEDASDTAQTMLGPAPGIAHQLGGYEMRQKLGQGGMGAVYLARQISLDRNVAVKVLHPTFAADPQFVARFTREAYAAAQLAHHNVVQIHDIGEEKATHFFSMEFVEGQTLGDLIRREGRVDADVAVGYILQSARGLKFAHDHGMIHRDIKPENLLLNNQGIVKVADMGLVKTAGSPETKMREGTRSSDIAASSAHVTSARTVMGTPAYMAPEQCTDSTTVDARADIYALGCTLYALLTGHPPFTGKTAAEVMTKQVREPIIPPHMVVSHVPERLSQILMKMVAKKPAERYQNLTDVIKDMEAFLGVESSGPFTPKEEHVRILEGATSGFNGASWARLRGNLIGAFFAAGILAAILLYWNGRELWGGGMIGMMVLSTAWYFVLSGIGEKTHLFRSVRQFVFASRITDWLTWIAGLLVPVVVLWVMELHWVWLGFAVVSLGLAAILYFGIDRLVKKQREVPLIKAEEMLKSMRLRGLEENAIRNFVCKYTGERWEEFYEALFGYEAKIEARGKWGKGDRGTPRRKFRSWREPIIAWIDHRQRLRQEEKERKHLQHVETRSLEAAGVPFLEARKKAKKRAENLVYTAAVVRESMLKPARAKPAMARGSAKPSEMETAAEAPAISLMTMMKEDIDDERPHRREHHHHGYVGRRVGGPLDVLLGAPLRFALALILLAGFAAWRYQNKDATINEFTSTVARVREDPTVTVKNKDVSAVAIQEPLKVEKTHARPLEMRFLPSALTMVLGTWNAGVAGLLLLIAVFFRGKLLGITVLLAAAVMVLGWTWTGHTVTPAGMGEAGKLVRETSDIMQKQMGSAEHARWLTLVIGIGLWLLAVFFLRPKAAD